MPLVKRSPRKVIKLSEAADILQVSRATVREMILRQELQLAPVPRRGRTSPLKLYAASVNAKAQEWGIL
jgi:transposase